MESLFLSPLEVSKTISNIGEKPRAKKTIDF